MRFRTEISIENPGFTLSHSSRVMLLGSCFTQSVGSRMADAMMRVVANPFGTLYNPASITAAVERLAARRLVTSDEIFCSAGAWGSLDFHTSFNRATPSEALETMNACIAAASDFLPLCDALFVTFGTAFVYRKDGAVVANCHKLPAAQFKRSMLSVDEVTEAIGRILAAARGANPRVKIILTVSPIRHIADGLADNSLSKSTLRVAIGEAVRLNPGVCVYFPSMEALIDDLRDYRFYAADMLHPSEVAVDYIWQWLKSAYFDAASQALIERCERMTRRLLHRPMSRGTEAAAKFQADTAAALKALKAELPYIQAEYNP